jgi:phosphate transport system substrate-binding protein
MSLGLRLISVGAVACAASVGCGHGSSDGELHGLVRFEAPTALVPLSEVIAGDFRRRNPDVRIVVRRADDAEALESLCAGKIDIAGASRSIRPAEAEACNRKGISFGEAAIANEAVVVVLNPSYPKTCIRVEHLKQVWRPERPISNWSQIANLELGFDARIERFSPDPSSAAFELFTAVINGVEGRQTKDYVPAGKDETRTIDRVARSEGAIGYVGFSSAPGRTQSVTEAEVESLQTGMCVPPNPFTVQDGSYSPLSRELLLYSSAEALDESSARAFLDYYRAHAREIAKSVGLIPLSEAQLEEDEEGSQ